MRPRTQHIVWLDVSRDGRRLAVCVDGKLSLYSLTFDE
jgi:hypothetical protein